MLNNNHVDTIKRSIGIKDVIQQLGGLGLEGKLQGNCPTGHDSKGGQCFSINAKGNYYHCFHCGEGGDIIDLVRLVEKKNFVEAVKWLDETFHINISHKLTEINPTDRVNLKELYAKDALYSLVFQKGKELLYSDIGKVALNYLIEARGYKLENLKQTDWIYFPKDKEIRNYLLSEHPESKEQIAKLELQGASGDRFRLAFPYKTRDGLITGFIKRATEPNGITWTDREGQIHKDVRYDSTKGLSKDDLFNLCNCKDYKYIIIVEGYPDALYLPTLNIKNIVAIGQGLLSKRHLEGLKALNIEKVTICFDNDKAGIENTEKAIELLKETGIETYTIEPTLMKPYKDPDEFVKANGIEAFKELCEMAELREAEPSAGGDQEPETNSKSKKKKSDSQATILVKLCQQNNVRLWHTKEKLPMATFVTNKHCENWLTGSKTFKAYLQRLYYQHYKTAPGKTSVSDAINVLDGLALFDGIEQDAFIRLAYDDRIYLDLVNDKWQVVEIDSSGWRVLDNSPIAFRRGRGMLALPKPTQQGNLYAIFDIFNVEAITQSLIMSWLIGAMNQHGPFPILVVNGEQGSGKSTLCKLLKNTMDPCIATLKSLPREERDLIISANNSWILSYDNISGISDWISDAMCRLSTGGGFSIRELYSDSEEMIFDVKRPIMLNGIENMGLRGDFSDRVILVNLPPIESKSRLDEQSIEAKFKELHPTILGGLCDTISAALKHIDSVKLDVLPRMADFALWITASEPAIGVKKLVELYQKNKDEQSEIVLEASLVGSAIIDFMATRALWEGTLKQLLDELDNVVDAVRRKEKSYPKDATRLSGKLRRDLPQLRQAGIDITFEGHGRTGNLVKLKKVKVSSCEAV